MSRICHRRSCRLRDEHHDHGIKALTHQISEMRLYSLADQVTEVSGSSTNTQSHVLARTQKVNPISKSALEFKNDTQTTCIDFSDPVRTSGNCPSPSTTFRQSTQRNSLRTGLPFRRAIQQDDKVVETLFGTFRLRSRTLLISNQSKGPTCSEEEDHIEYENIFEFIPPSWLARFGFTYGLSGRISQSPLSGSKVALDVVRSVPDDAVIFDLCREGRIGCVQALLNRGEASAKDVDSQGRTPLYVSLTVSCFGFYRLFQEICPIVVLTILSIS